MNSIEAIRIGVVTFARRTLLLLAEPDAMAEFARRMEGGETIEIGGRDRDSGVSLKFEPGPSSGCLVVSGDGKRFLWTMSLQERTVVAAQLKELARMKPPSGRHAYLDPERSRTGVEIVASVGEYDLDHFFEAI